MKRWILSAVACCALAGAVVVAAEQGEKKAPPPPTTRPSTQPSQAKAKPINKFCAVNRDEEVDPAITTTYKGKTIGFCCEDCLPKFKKDPEKYMKDLK